MSKSLKNKTPHPSLLWVLWLEGIHFKFLYIFIVVNFITKNKKGTTQGSTIFRNYDYTKVSASIQLEDNIMIKRIEELREELNELFASEGLAQRSLEKSQELDKLVVLEQRMRLENSTLEVIA